MVVVPLMLAEGIGLTVTLADALPVSELFEHSGEPEVSVMLCRVSVVLLVSTPVVNVKVPSPVPDKVLELVPSR